MIRPASLVVFLYLLHARAQESGENYFFHFRRTEFYDTDLLRNMLKGVDRMVESLNRRMEVRCRFTSAAEEYKALQESAPTCATDQDKKTLEKALSGFKANKEECVKKADCKSEISKAIERAATSIENIDADGWAGVTACGADNECKYKEYGVMHDRIFELYVASRPKLRLMADQGVASFGCGLAIVTCMVNSNEAALRSMYEAAARIQECREGKAPTNTPMVLPPYMNAPSRTSKQGWFGDH